MKNRIYHDMNIKMTSTKCITSGLTRALFLIALFSIASSISAEEIAKGEVFKKPWQTDIIAFKKHIRKIAAAARTPSEEEFVARYEDGPEGEIGVVEDFGALDFKPAKDTVQFKINETLKGRVIRWEFELRGDLDDPPYGGQLFLWPKWEPEIGPKPVGKEKTQVQTVLCDPKTTKIPAIRPHAGERIRVEGRIGDSSKNNDEAPWYSGPTVFYYQSLGPPLSFWIELEKVTITRVGDKPSAPSPIDPLKPKPGPALEYKIAVPVPGKEGFVFNPFTNKMVDVSGITPGRLVRDPMDPDPTHKFRVPSVKKEK